MTSITGAATGSTNIDLGTTRITITSPILEKAGKRLAAAELEMARKIAKQRAAMQQQRSASDILADQLAQSEEVREQQAPQQQDFVLWDKELKQNAPTNQVDQVQEVTKEQEAKREDFALWQEELNGKTDTERAEIAEQRREDEHSIAARNQVYHFMVEEVKKGLAARGVHADVEAVNVSGRDIDTAVRATMPSDQSITPQNLGVQMSRAIKNVDDAVVEALPKSAAVVAKVEAVQEASTDKGSGFEIVVEQFIGGEVTTTKVVASAQKVAQMALMTTGLAAVAAGPAIGVGDIGLGLQMAAPASN